jgi:hypothetical protein
MEKLKRLICEYEHPVLYVHIDGEINSGDLINFSYSLMRRLSKTTGSFYIFCDLSNCIFNLMDGLEMKVFAPFFENALNKEVARISILPPKGKMSNYDEIKKNPRVRLFDNDYSAALSWLSTPGVFVNA